MIHFYIRYNVYFMFVSMSYVTAENWLETMNGLQ